MTTERFKNCSNLMFLFVCLHFMEQEVCLCAVLLGAAYLHPTGEEVKMLLKSPGLFDKEKCESEP